jgi:hypothetical protein
MKRFVLPLLLVCLGCTAKESSPVEVWADKGEKRVSVLAPKDGGDETGGKAEGVVPDPPAVMHTSTCKPT